LHLIYKNSGAFDLARQVLKNHCTFWLNILDTDINWFARISGLLFCTYSSLNRTLGKFII
jgi:hypothetical protein